MERTVKLEQNDIIRWKKIGGGGLHLNGRIIKPGQVFTARVSDIPKAFRDLCLPLDEIKEVVPPPINVIKYTYTVVPRGKSKSLFDVVDDKGKVLNEKALTKAVAEQLVSDLEK